MERQDIQVCSEVIKTRRFPYSHSKLERNSKSAYLRQYGNVRGYNYS